MEGWERWEGNQWGAGGGKEGHNHAGFTFRGREREREWSSTRERPPIHTNITLKSRKKGARS